MGGGRGKPAGVLSRRRQAALFVLGALAEDRTNLTLDHVDGNFYWRVCRLDLQARILALRRERPILLEDPPRPWARDLFTFLEEGVAWAGAFMHFHTEVRDLYPRPVWHMLSGHGHVPMRPAEVVYQLADDGTSSRCIRVYSGAWTGADVERELRPPDFEAVAREIDRRKALSAGAVSMDEPRGDAAHTDAGHGGSTGGAVSPGGTPRVETTVHARVALRMEFALVRTAPDDFFDRHRRAPYVEVTVRRPMPAGGLVAREYDRVVRELHRWHLELPGATSRQEIDVALRTWAVGLLAADGVRFHDAMRAVCERAALPEVTQARFGQDRQRLLARVPEAQPYLFARAGRSAALAKGGEGGSPSQP